MSEKPSLKSRKIVSFILVVLSVLALVALMSYMGTPEHIATAAFWVVGSSGLFLIGGQALIDTVVPAFASWKGGQKTTVNSTTTIKEQG